VITVPAPEPKPPRLSAEERGRLAEFLATGSLYTKEEFVAVRAATDPIEWFLPPEIRLTCESEKCDGMASYWELASVSGDIPPGAVGGLVYSCRTCGAEFHVWFRWEVLPTGENLAKLQGIQYAPVSINVALRFEKVGQYPALSIDIPPDLEKALGPEHATLFRRGLLSLNHGFGIGAHGYFRRVVEETMDEMLTLLAAALKEGGADVETIQRVEAAKREKAFDKKAKVAADALPDHMKPGGFNPFARLHTFYSEGIHAKTDAECIALVGQMRDALDAIFTKLKTQVSAERKYLEAAKRLQQLQDNRKPIE